MTSRDFAYWLQGFFEISGDDAFIGDRELQIIRAHLNMVFIHEIDPSFPADQQDALTEAHEAAHPAPTLYERRTLIKC